MGAEEFGTKNAKNTTVRKQAKMAENNKNNAPRKRPKCPKIIKITAFQNGQSGNTQRTNGFTPAISAKQNIREIHNKKIHLCGLCLALWDMEGQEY